MMRERNPRDQTPRDLRIARQQLVRATQDYQDLKRDTAPYQKVVDEAKKVAWELLEGVMNTAFRSGWSLAADQHSLVLGEIRGRLAEIYGARTALEILQSKADDLQQARERVENLSSQQDIEGT